MTEIVPTVTIIADNTKGRRIINKSDYDPTKHTLFGAVDPGQGSLNLSQGPTQGSVPTAKPALKPTSGRR